MEWISVKDRLPGDDREHWYLAFLADGHMRLGRLHPYDVVSGHYINVHAHIFTHWAELPAPPEEEQ